jgi:hypothetical protein
MEKRGCLKSKNKLCELERKLIMRNNKTLNWTQLINSSKTVKEVAAACTTICADKSFIEQYSKGHVQAGTISKVCWYDICKRYKFPYSFKHLENWNLQVSVLDPVHEYKIIPGVLDDNGMPRIAKPMCDEVTGKTIYDPETGLPVYKEVGLYTKYAPSVVLDPETGVWEKRYYTSKQYPYKEALELLKEAGATEAYDAFKEVYRLYATLTSRCRKDYGWQLKKGGAALVNRMLSRYEEAHAALYRYNASFISASRDVRKKCVDLEFEAKLKAEEGTHHADDFTLSEEYKIIVAAIVFEFGIADAELIEGVFDNHAETFKFKENYTMRVSGIADAPRTLDDPHQWTTYHDVEDTDPVLTFLGKRVEKLFIGDTKAKLLQCYDWVMSLSEEDREPFYRTWVDDEGVTHTIRNLNDYAEMHWQLPQDKQHIGYRDYQVGLYADEGVDEEDIEYLFNELSDALPENDAVQDENTDDFRSCIDEEDEAED